MRWLNRVRNYFRGLARGREDERELDAEVRAYAEMLGDEKTRKGMGEEEARRAARVEMGGIEQVKEEVRSARAGVWLETLWQDVRFGARMLRKSPGFTAVAVLTLALGIGANTAIFSLIDAVILQMLPVRHPEELVLVADLHAEPHGFQVVSYSVWPELRARQDIFSGVFAWSQRQFDLAQGGEAHNADGLLVSGDYFNTLGVRPAVGRLLTTNDDFRGCPGSAVLSYGFWQSRYGANPNVVGNVITLDDHAFQVVGVSAAGFFGVEAGNKFDVAIPLCAVSILDPNSPMLGQWSFNPEVRIMGRLKPGVSVEQANARLAVLSPSIYADTVPPDWKGDYLRSYLATRLEALPCATGLSGVREDYERPLRFLMVVVGLVLLIACANIACLLLARATARKKEIALRLAVGASRWRLIRQLLTESVLLSLAGTFLGLFLARGSDVILVRIISTQMFTVVQKPSITLALDWRVLGFTAGVAVLASILFGVLPAVLSTRISLISAMKGPRAGEAEHRSRFRPARWIVAAQVALSLVLLLVAGLFLQSFWKLATLDAGFDRKNVLLMNVNMHNANVTEAQRSEVCAEILERLRALPGVTSAGQSLLTPIAGRLMFFLIHSRVPNAPTARDAMPYANFVSPGFLATSGTPLLSGRDFAEGDTTEKQPVAIINQTMARNFFPGVDPVGKSFEAQLQGQKLTEVPVIGVVADAKFMSLRENFHATAYFPAAQLTPYSESWSFEMRTGLRPSAVQKTAAVAVGSVNKAISLQFSTLEQQVDNSIMQERLLAALSVFFGGLAVLLAMVGLYGVLSYSVAQRVQEIGIRVALGAKKWDVLRMVIGQGFRLALTGVVIGTVAALILARLLSSFSDLLYGVKTSDPVTFAAVSLLTIGVAILACYIPARRATKVDPMVALRYE